MRVHLQPMKSLRLLHRTPTQDVYLGPLGVAFAVPSGTPLEEVRLECETCNQTYPAALVNGCADDCPYRVPARP